MGGETRLVLLRVGMVVPVPEAITLLIERDVARRLAEGSTIVLLVVPRVLARFEMAVEADVPAEAAGVAGTE